MSLYTQPTLPLSTSGTVLNASCSMVEDENSAAWGTLIRVHGEAVATERRYDLDTDRPFVIGRGSGCDLVLGDAKVSTSHCVIERCPETLAITLKDCSMNGTYLNKKRLMKNRAHRLRAGDEIGIVKDSTQASFVLVSFVFRVQYHVGTDLGGGPLSQRGNTMLSRSLSRGFPSYQTSSSPPAISWQKGTLIGKGGFGEVYLAINCVTGGMLAVKALHLQPGVDSETANEEVRLLKRLSHENVVRYLDSEVDTATATLNVVMEYVPGGSLLQLIQKFGCFHESVISGYCKQILRGLQYLHDCFVIHRDIKAANILITDTGVVKLSDFGSALALKRQQTDGAADGGVQRGLILGTPQWIAPEVLTQDRVSFESDVWSFGCVLIEMCTAHAPWSECGFDNQPAVLYHICHATAPPRMPEPPQVSQELHALMQRCLQIAASNRPSCAELQRDPFVASRKATLHADLQSGGEVRLERPDRAKRRRLDNAGRDAEAEPVTNELFFGDTCDVSMQGTHSPPPPQHSCYLKELSHSLAISGDFPRSASNLDPARRAAPTGLTAEFDAFQPLRLSGA